MSFKLIKLLTGLVVILFLLAPAVDAGSMTYDNDIKLNIVTSSLSTSFSPEVILVVDNDMVTGREQRVNDFLTGYGYNVTRIKESDADLSTLTGYGMVVFVEYYPSIGPSLIDSLLMGGNNITMLYESFQMISGFMNHTSLGVIYPYTNQTFLSGYDLSQPITVQYGDVNNPCINSYSLTYYWQANGKVGPDHYSDTTSAYYAGFGTGRGAIFTYDPFYLHNEGMVIFEKVLRYVSGNKAAKVTIPQDKVALLVEDYAGTSLTDRETGVKQTLEAKGYDVEVVSNHDRTLTDYDDSLFVVQAEYFEFKQRDYYTGLLDDGVDMLLLYAAGQMLSGETSYISSNDMFVLENESVLGDYDEGHYVPAHVGDSGYPFFDAYKLPEDWTGIGSRRPGDVNDVTLARYSGTTGRGVIFTYDPLYYSGEAGVVLEKNIRYVTAQAPAPSIVPPATVALVVKDYSGKNLTPRESMVKQLLEDEGDVVTVVSDYDRTFTDYSDAKLVVQAEYFDLVQNGYYTRLMDNATNLLFLYEAGQSLTGPVDHASDLELVVLDNESFLDRYDIKDVLNVQGSGSSYPYFNDSLPPGWTNIGSRATAGFNDVTCAYRQGPSGRSAIYSYDPLTYTPAGMDTFVYARSYVTSGHSVDTFTIPLSTGWNLISIPLVNDTIWGNNLSKFGVISVSEYNRTTGRYDIFIPGISMPDSDINILPDKGYFLYGSYDALFNVTGPYDGNRSIDIYQGWNLIGWSNITASDALSVAGRLDDVQSLATYNTSTGGYDIYIENISMSVANFDMSPGNGYFIYSSSTIAQTLRF